MSSLPIGGLFIWPQIFSSVLLETVGNGFKSKEFWENIFFHRGFTLYLYSTLKSTKFKLNKKRMKVANRPSTYKRISQSEKLKIAFMNRRRGDVKKVAELTGYDPTMVSKVLSGVRNNKRIVNVAYDIARNRKGATA